MDRLFHRAVERLNALPHENRDTNGRSWIVPPKFGRRFAVTDIHGCWQTFIDLLAEIELNPDDQLFILGDMINRGPYSLRVLETVAELLDRGFSVYPLRGNHEDMVLDYDERHKKKKLKATAKRRNSLHLVNKHGQLKSGVRHFLNHLPYFFETEEEFMVHAGFDTSLEKPFEEWDRMLTIRSFHYDEPVFDGKPIFHGHVPTRSRGINWAVDSLRDQSVKGSQEDKSERRSNVKIAVLDNGCVNVSKIGQGNLACLELNSKELIFQKNSDVIRE